VFDTCAAAAAPDRLIRNGGSGTADYFGAAAGVAVGFSNPANDGSETQNETYSSAARCHPADACQASIAQQKRLGRYFARR
jgi:hypothetical protein